MFFRLCILSVGLLMVMPAVAQVNPVIYNEVKDSIIARFNRNDFRGIYQYIAGPLGMNRTTYHLANEDKKQLATPYSENGRPILYQNEGLFGPAGDIHADLADMVTYLQAQLAEKNPAIKLAHQPTRNNTGLGWGVRQVDHYRDIQHNGSTPGFTSHLSAFPELNSGCVVLENNKATMGKLIGRIQALVKEK